MCYNTRALKKRPNIYIWRHSQAVRQRSAKPLSPVRFRVAPPKNPESSAFRIFSFVSAQFAKRTATQHHLRGTRNIIWALAQHHCPLADTNERCCTSCKWCASQWCDASHQWCCASRKRISPSGLEKYKKLWYNKIRKSVIIYETQHYNIQIK